MDEINSLRVADTYLTLELDSSISLITPLTDAAAKNKESHVIEVMLLLKWDCFQTAFLRVFFACDLTFPAEHLGNWNNKVAQRGSILNASHKQDLTYTVLASNFLKLRGQEHLKKRLY